VEDFGGGEATIDGLLGDTRDKDLVVILDTGGEAALGRARSAHDEHYLKHAERAKPTGPPGAPDPSVEEVRV
jgi:hypothetical protein